MALLLQEVVVSFQIFKIETNKTFIYSKFIILNII